MPSLPTSGDAKTQRAPVRPRRPPGTPVAPPGLATTVPRAQLDPTASLLPQEPRAVPSPQSLGLVILRETCRALLASAVSSAVVRPGEPCLAEAGNVGPPPPPRAPTSTLCGYRLVLEFSHELRGQRLPPVRLRAGEGGFRPPEHEEGARPSPACPCSPSWCPKWPCGPLVNLSGALGGRKLRAERGAIRIPHDQPLHT